MKPTLVLKVIFLCLLAGDIFAQNKYWVSLNDERSVRLVDSLSLTPTNCSEWLNSCSYQLNPVQTQVFQTKGIKLQTVKSFNPHQTQAEASNLAFALEQIHAEAILQKGLNGRGVKIGIIDGGFLYADNAQSLSRHFDEGRVVYYRDYVTPDLEPYSGAAGLDDNHGTEVWELIGGYNHIKNIQYGLATQSTYYLARTDHGGYERRLEEDYIIAAMEEMHNMGVRLINLSLGYTDGYKNPEENYVVADVNGKTSMLTRAVDIASIEKGILIVVSAGNDGNKQWQTLSIPADAKHALTVGSSKFQVFDKMDYSSIGPENLTYLKPNLSVYSTLGTSFSAPVITGLAACMMQYDSLLTNQDIIGLMQKSGNFYPFGNNYVGYGVPDCRSILSLIDGKHRSLDQVRLKKCRKNSLILRGDFEGKTIVIFNKSDAMHVMHRINMRPSKNKLRIKRPDNCKQSSVLVEKEVIEIEWVK